MGKARVRLDTYLLSLLSQILHFIDDVVDDRQAKTGVIVVHEKNKLLRRASVPKDGFGLVCSQMFTGFFGTLEYGLSCSPCIT